MEISIAFFLDPNLSLFLPSAIATSPRLFLPDLITGNIDKKVHQLIYLSFGDCPAVVAETKRSTNKIETTLGTLTLSITLNL